jgi:hypothetical protein
MIMRFLAGDLSLLPLLSKLQGAQLETDSTAAHCSRLAIDMRALSDDRPALQALGAGPGGCRTQALR